jgi:hypothetical protein
VKVDKVYLFDLPHADTLILFLRFFGRLITRNLDSICPRKECKLMIFEFFFIVYRARRKSGSSIVVLGDDTLKTPIGDYVDLEMEMVNQDTGECENIIHSDFIGAS